MPLLRLSLHQYPKMVKALDQRHIMYNAQLDYVRKREEEGRVLVIRPKEKLKIGHISHDPEEMQAVYDCGVEAAHEHLEAIKNFLSE